MTSVPIGVDVDACNANTLSAGVIQTLGACQDFDFWPFGWVVLNAVRRSEHPSLSQDRAAKLPSEGISAERKQPNLPRSGASWGGVPTNDSAARGSSSVVLAASAAATGL